MMTPAVINTYTRMMVMMMMMIMIIVNKMKYYNDNFGCNIIIPPTIRNLISLSART